MDPPRSGSRLASLLSLGAGLAAVLATWVLPSPKADAALGRYTYPEFVLAILATGLFLAVAVVVLTSPPRRRRCLFRVSAITLSILATLLLTEAVAFLLPLKRNPFYISNEGAVLMEGMIDPRLPYIRPPHMNWEGWSQGDVPDWIPDKKSERRRISFQTDSEGFRNPSDIPRADLVFIGDSFTEAGNVPDEKSFVRLTSARLGRSAKNLGVFGYDPLSELILLDQYGLKCDPRVVVWQLCEANDVRDALGQAQAIEIWKKTGAMPERKWRPNQEKSWSWRSPSYTLFRRLQERKRDWLGGSFRDAAGRDHEMRFGYWPSADHFPLGHGSASWKYNGHPGWHATVATIEEGHRLLASRGIQLVLLHIPMKLTVYARYIELDEVSAKSLPYYPATLPRVDGEQSIGHQLGLLCNRLGVPYVDATPHLEKAAAAGELVFFPNDTHINERGHEIITDALTPVLGELLK